MNEILVTYKMQQQTTEDMKHYPLKGHVAYEPWIGCPDLLPQCKRPKTPEEVAHFQQKSLSGLLRMIRPRVLIVGNTPVGAETVGGWREEVPEGPLTIVRRGTELGGIDKNACERYGVIRLNTPGINSPYVAKHMLEHFPLNNGIQKAGVLGVGEIGKHIVQEALAVPSLEVAVFSPSLANSHRQERLRELGLPSSGIIFAADPASVFKGAEAVAISIPWENTNGGHNKGVYTLDHVRGLAHGATIVSCSNPWVFTQDALTYLNTAAQTSEVIFHNDTGTKYAKDAQRQYPNLNALPNQIEYDKAFADPKCQRQLDVAVLNAGANQLGMGKLLSS